MPRDRDFEHVPRVAGAQFMVRAGIQELVVKLFARWGSDAILRYIQEAPLTASHGLARTAVGNISSAEYRATIQDARTVQTASHEKIDIDVIVEEVMRKLKIQDEAKPLVAESVVGHVASTPAPDIPAKYRFVRNDHRKSGVVHVTRRSPPNSTKDEWCTCCSWPFGHLDFTWLDSVPPSAATCTHRACARALKTLSLAALPPTAVPFTSSSDDSGSDGASSSSSG